MLEDLQNIAVDFWTVLGQMSPYLLLGFLTAGVLSVFISPAFVERHLGGRKFWSVVKASALGVPLPLCSCGVIPVSASLRRHGAGRGATTAFLISTPQTGVDSIFVTYSLLGGVFAIFRPMVALVSGLIGGFAVGTLDTDGDAEADAPVKCEAACCSGADEGGRLRRALSYGFGALPKDIAKPLLGGLIIAALISALVPKNLFADYLGGGIGAMLVMMLLGIPVYACATASVPIAASMITAGVSPGAALVFLMTAPATNAATIATVWKVMGRRTALLYLGTVALTALGSGLLLDYIFTTHNISMQMAHEMLPEWFKVASALALLGLLGFAVFRPTHTHDHAHEDEDEHDHGHDHDHEELELAVGGMTCSHCADSVRRALLETAGVESADIDVSAGRARVVGVALAPEGLLQAVRSLGFDAELAGGSTGE